MWVLAFVIVLLLLLIWSIARTETAEDKKPDKKSDDEKPEPDDEKPKPDDEKPKPDDEKP